MEAAAVLTVVTSCYLVIRQHYHRNRDCDYSLLSVSSFSFADWREPKPKPLLSLSSRCSSFAPIVSLPKAEEAAKEEEEPPPPAAAA